MSMENSSSQSPLCQAAHALAQRYHAQPQLVRDQQGWSRAIALCADDCDDAVCLQIDDGHVAAISNPALRDSARSAASSAPPDVVIRGSQALLQRILRLQQLPSEPYLFGEIIVEGPEPDFLRLDYIVTTLAQRSASPIEDRR